MFLFENRAINLILVKCNLKVFLGLKIKMYGCCIKIYAKKTESIAEPYSFFTYGSLKAILSLHNVL